MLSFLTPVVPFVPRFAGSFYLQPGVSYLTCSEGFWIPKEDTKQCAWVCDPLCWPLEIQETEDGLG